MTVFSKIKPNKIGAGTETVELVYSLDDHGWYFQDIRNHPMTSQFFDSSREAMDYFAESDNGKEILWADNSQFDA